jgi:tetratricopeptide (TPR) repeat protein
MKTNHKYIAAALGTGLIILWSARAVGEESSTTYKDSSIETTSIDSTIQIDDEWLNTIWTQVDDMVKVEEHKLQETVTVAGVRGAEAKDSILDRLYFKGGKRYPTQSKLEQAITQLRTMYDDKETMNKGQVLFFMAQVYEKLGQPTQAIDAYRELERSHKDSPYSNKAGTALKTLEEIK